VTGRVEQAGQFVVRAARPDRSEARWGQAEARSAMEEHDLGSGIHTVMVDPTCEETVKDR
jgi:hypothetical protein